MGSLLTGSRVGTPWYCAYSRLTIGVAAKIEGAKQKNMKNKGPHLLFLNSKVGLLLFILLGKSKIDRNRRRFED